MVENILNQRAFPRTPNQDFLSRNAVGINETDEQRAERLVGEWLEAEGWSQTEVSRQPKGDPKKTQLAFRLREETPLTRQWIATRLAMGSAPYISHLTAQTKDCRL